MFEMNEKTFDLKGFWLTENQSLLYQIWLQMGTRSVTALARQAQMHRVLCYNILQELCKMGLCSSMTLWNTGYYAMVEPKVFREKLANKVDMFTLLLPWLESLIKQGGDGFKVQSYSWFDGMKTLYDHLIHSTTDLKAFLWADHIDPVFRDYLYEVYLPKRIAKWIHNKALVSATDHNSEFADTEKVPLTQVVIIPDPLFDMSTEIVLFDETKILIACLSPTEMSGMLVQSKNLYHTLDNIFELLWRLHMPLQNK